MATARHGHAALLLHSGKVLVVGGCNAVGASREVSLSCLASAEVYDPKSETWNSAASMAKALEFRSVTPLPSGKALVAGGCLSARDWTEPGLRADAGAEVYDPLTEMWSTTGSVQWHRYGHTATLLPSGKVLVAGGQDIGEALGSAEVYDPSTGAWSATDSLAWARYGHTATLLPSGKVLVAGGCGVLGMFGKAELYDPATGTWRAVGSLVVPRELHTATLLASGKVLVAGGETGQTWADVLASAELYDSTAETWSGSGRLQNVRSGHTASLLPSGRVLVAGGPFRLCREAELYDPATQTSSNTHPLAMPRQAHSATLLASGSILIAGGQDGDGLSLSSTEVYRPETESLR